MSNRIVIVCSAEMATGYRMAGTRTITVMNTKEALKRVKLLLKDESIGLVAVEDAFYSKFDKEAITKIESSEMTVVMSIPFVETKKRTDEIEKETIIYVEKMIERSSGIYIKIK